VTLVGAIFIYFIIWWLVLFAVLPWGNRPHAEPEEGHVASAPANPRLALKFTITTAISAVLFLVAWGFVEAGWITLRE
jgi:predicted secreted protein